MTWETIAQKHRDAVNSAIPLRWKLPEYIINKYSVKAIDFPVIEGYLTRKELEITELSATDLVKKLANGKLKAFDVTEAFCHRAAIAHQLVNCCIDIFFDEALIMAKELDAYYAKYKKPVGPLHGLPISLKDQFRIKGRVTSMGYVSWANDIETEDSQLTKILRDAGAVFYVKTNIPTGLMCGINY